MTPKITTLIDKQDTYEIVRDQIAAILAIEIENQRVLAIGAGKNPDDFYFSTYIERSRPWEISEMPLVNVLFDNDIFDRKGSGMLKEQKPIGTFHIDCYGTKDATDDNTGDELTSREVDRIARLARNILMHNGYTYLDLQGTVATRYIMRREKFIPNINMEGYENVIGCRLICEVGYVEYSPQTVPENLELLILECKRAQDGKVYFIAEYDLTA
jgi:hypothetical protein